MSNVYIQLLVFKTLRLPRTDVVMGNATPDDPAALDVLLDSAITAKVANVRAQCADRTENDRLASPLAYAFNALSAYDRYMLEVSAVVLLLLLCQFEFFSSCLTCVAQYAVWEREGPDKALPPLRPLGPKPSIAKFGIVAKTTMRGGDEGAPLQQTQPVAARSVAVGRKVSAQAQRAPAPSSPTTQAQRGPPPPVPSRAARALSRPASPPPAASPLAAAAVGLAMPGDAGELIVVEPFDDGDADG